MKVARFEGMFNEVRLEHERCSGLSQKIEELTWQISALKAENEQLKTRTETRVESVDSKAFERRIHELTSQLQLKDERLVSRDMEI